MQVFLDDIFFACDECFSGVTAAKGGTLTFMVGGEDEAYKKATKILQHMGKNVIHTGATGTGQVIKVVENQSICRRSSWEA